MPKYKKVNRKNNTQLYNVDVITRYKCKMKISKKKLQHSFANYAIKTIVINAVQKPIRRERGAKKQKKKSGTNKTQENA